MSALDYFPQAVRQAQKFNGRLYIIDRWGDYTNNSKTTHILFLTQHEPLRVQIDRLKELFPNAIVFHYQGKTPNIDFALDLIDKLHIEIVIPIIPLSIIRLLVEESKKRNYAFKVVFSEMEDLYITYDTPQKTYDTTFAPIRDSEGRRAYKVFKFRRFKWIRDIIFVEEELG